MIEHELQLNPNSIQTDVYISVRLFVREIKAIAQ